MVSWLCVNVGDLVTKGKGTRPNHGNKEGRRGTEDRVYWSGACGLLGDVQTIFNARMALPRPFCRWGLSVMVRMRGEYESRTGEEEPGVHLVVAARLRFDRSSDGTAAPQLLWLRAVID